MSCQSVARFSGFNSVIADETSQSGRDNNEGLCHVETHNPKRQTMRNVQLFNV